MEGLGHLPPPLLWSSALRVLYGVSHQRMSPAQAHKRLCISSAYAGSETEHAFPEIYPGGSCGCEGISIWHCLLLCLAFQYSIPACGQLPMPTGAPPWLPGGPYHVSGPSLGSESWVQFGGWAMEWPQQPHFGPLPAWWYLPFFIGGSSRRTECLWWPSPSIWAHRVAGHAAFWACIPHGRGPKSPPGKSDTPQAHGRSICLRVQPWKTMPTTSGDQPFCFLPSQLCGMHKHPLKDDGVMQPSNLP